MRQLLTLLLFLIPYQIFSQDQENTFFSENWSRYDHLDLAIGFNRNSSSTTESTAYHSLELSLWKSVNFRQQYPASAALFFSQEVGMLSKRVTHASKAGVWLGFWGFIFGAEAKYLTDYKDFVFVASPFVGYGNYPLRISVGYEGVLASSGNLGNLRNINVNMSIAVFKLRNPRRS